MSDDEADEAELDEATGAEAGPRRGRARLGLGLGLGRVRSKRIASLVERFLPTLVATTQSDTPIRPSPCCIVCPAVEYE